MIVGKSTLSGTISRTLNIDGEGVAKSCYIQLFRRLASESRLAEFESDTGPFKVLWDDLRPANVLVDKDNKIVAVIEWEFTYAAPAEFSYSPPWWLLLTVPEEWSDGLEDWSAKCIPRLATLLSAMEDKERDSSSRAARENRRSCWPAYAAAGRRVASG